MNNDALLKDIEDARQSVEDATKDLLANAKWLSDRTGYYVKLVDELKERLNK